MPQVFGEKLGTKSMDLSILGAELLQAPCSESQFAEGETSPVGKLHLCLLDLVQSLISLPEDRTPIAMMIPASNLS